MFALSFCVCCVDGRAERRNLWKILMDTFGESTLVLLVSSITFHFERTLVCENNIEIGNTYITW